MILSEEKIKEIEEITMTDYCTRNGYASIAEIEIMIDDLISEVKHLREQLENSKEISINEPDYDEIGKDIRFGLYEQ